MTLQRRQFLIGSASAAFVASSARVPRIWAETNRRAFQAGGDRILVIVQFTGGNDGLNTVIPYGDDQYHKNRFATRIANDAVLKIDDYLGWHPSLVGWSELQQQSRLSIVQGVGYPNPNRSHFESMDIWHSATMQGPFRTGWIGRWLDEDAVAPRSESATEQNDSPAIRGLHIGSEPLPLAMTGLNVMVPSLRTIDSLRVTDDALVREALAAEVNAPATKHELLEFVRQSRAVALNAAQRLEALQQQAASGYDGSNLSRKLASVAQLIAVEFGPRVYYVELGGFDTHSQQPAAHAALLTEASRAVTAFHRDLERRSLSDRVLTVCFSEFGRRVRENGSQGTDHGTAAPLILAGPQGLPPLLGKYPSLTDLDNGDLRFTTDFRSVYATVLEQWLGVPSDGVLGQPFPPLPLFA